MYGRRPLPRVATEMALHVLAYNFTRGSSKLKLSPPFQVTPETAELPPKDAPRRQNNQNRPNKWAKCYGGNGKLSGVRHNVSTRPRPKPDLTSIQRRMMLFQWRLPQLVSRISANGIRPAITPATKIRNFLPECDDEDESAFNKGLGDRLIRNRTQLANAIRGYAAEFGVAAAKGIARLVPLLDRIQADKSLPGLARELFAIHAKEYAQVAGANRGGRGQTYW